MRTPTPHAGLLPLADPRPQGKLVMAGYNMPAMAQVGPIVGRTITYTYDPLYRLTAADYSEETTSTIPTML